MLTFAAGPHCLFYLFSIIMPWCKLLYISVLCVFVGYLSDDISSIYLSFGGCSASYNIIQSDDRKNRGTVMHRTLVYQVIKE